MDIKKYAKTVGSLFDSLKRVGIRRLKSGPKLPEWTLLFELFMEFLNLQFQTAAEIESEESIDQARKFLDTPPPPLPVFNEVQFRQADTPVESRWIESDNGSDRSAVILYLHGGGFVHYLNSHDLLMAHLANRLEFPMLVPDYRLAPENTHPAALEDVQNSYEWLLEAEGYIPEQIVVMGDSAGGDLVIELLLQLRNDNRTQPALGVGLSPWTDLLNRGDSIDENADYDYLQKGDGDRWARYYAGEEDLDDPNISPVEANLEGIAPLYIQAGEAESIIDMIRVFVRKAEDQDVDVALDTWDQMVHVFQSFADVQPEASEALDRLKTVVNGYIKNND